MAKCKALTISSVKGLHVFAKMISVGIGLRHTTPQQELDYKAAVAAACVVLVKCHSA